MIAVREVYCVGGPYDGKTVAVPEGQAYLEVASTDYSGRASHDAFRTYPTVSDLVLRRARYEIKRWAELRTIDGGELGEDTYTHWVMRRELWVGVLPGQEEAAERVARDRIQYMPWTEVERRIVPKFTPKVSESLFEE